MAHQFKRLSHSLYEYKYHIVFCPKYRYRIFRDDLAEYTHQQLESLCWQKDLVEVLEINIQPDPVHPSQIRRFECDGVPERETGATTLPTLRTLGQALLGQYLWSRGYGVSTVGLNEDKMRKYVKWQEAYDKQAEQTQQRLFD